MFTIDDKCLRRLASLNQFQLPNNDFVLFGLRGALPINGDDVSFAASVPADLAEVNYEEPRCLLGIWDLKKKQVLVAPGSTVPFLDAVKKAKKDAGKGVNQVLPSFISFEKGAHPRNPNKPQHSAFRQAQPFPFQRTADDFDYDNEDSVEVSWPGDNLHCAFCEGPDFVYRSSHGCQVVCGFAKRTIKGGADRGAWPIYRKAAYKGSQKRFRYMLLPGHQAKAASLSDPKTMAIRLRFGSSGKHVVDVQSKLKKSKLYSGPIDGDFGKGSLLAVLDFQEHRSLSQDGVVGPHVVEALGLKAKWAKV